MEKRPFLTEEQAQEIIQDVPTPFHVYDEKGIRENARRINKAFSWNKGFKEYFAVKALPNPIILQILKEEGCGVDCSSLTELMLSEACGFTGSDIMFSSNDTPAEEFAYARRLGAREAVLCDIEPEAMECLAENAALNGIEGWRGWTGSLDKLSDQSFDIFLANMLRSEFFPLREMALPRIAAGGALVLSGYLLLERELVLTWFAEAGLTLEAERREGEWWACVGRKA